MMMAPHATDSLTSPNNFVCCCITGLAAQGSPGNHLACNSIVIISSVTHTHGSSCCTLAIYGLIALSLVHECEGKVRGRRAETGRKGGTKRGVNSGGPYLDSSQMRHLMRQPFLPKLISAMAANNV